MRYSVKCRLAHRWTWAQLTWRRRAHVSSGTRRHLVTATAPSCSTRWCTGWRTTTSTTGRRTPRSRGSSSTASSPTKSTSSRSVRTLVVAAVPGAIHILYGLCHKVSCWWVTHTHRFNDPFSETTRISRYQKGKTSLDFTEARDSEWQWHQPGHKQVCISQCDALPLSFLRTRCPSCCPTNSVKALKTKVVDDTSDFLCLHLID